MTDFKYTDAMRQRLIDCKIINPELDEAMQKAIDEMVQKENLAIDNLTKEQVAEVLRQIFLSGDIARYVYATGPHRQNVVYAPYRREQELLDKIKELRDRLLVVTGENHL